MEKVLVCMALLYGASIVADRHRVRRVGHLNLYGNPQTAHVCTRILHCVSVQFAICPDHVRRPRQVNDLSN